MTKRENQTVKGKIWFILVGVLLALSSQGVFAAELLDHQEKIDAIADRIEKVDLGKKVDINDIEPSLKKLSAINTGQETTRSKEVNLWPDEEKLTIVEEDEVHLTLK